MEQNLRRDSKIMSPNNFMNNFEKIKQIIDKFNIVN